MTNSETRATKGQPAAALADPQRGLRLPARESRARALAVGGAMLAALALLIAVSTCVGSTGSWSLARTLGTLASAVGLAEPRDGTDELVVLWRLYRTLAAVGVGAALALSGGLLQGVFRNDLASPSVLGVTAGASVGAAIAILALGGRGPLAEVQGLVRYAPLVVFAGSFAGAGVVALAVTLFASIGGRISVPTLLLFGIALNAIGGGLLAAIQSFVLQDFELVRALFSWTFGTLDDRSGTQVALVFGALALAALTLPWVAYELDLFAAGEEDARALGVDTRRTRILAIGAAALATGVAVAVAGQIAFVGLVVPHLLRLVVGRSNRVLLPLCLVGGALFLLGAETLQALAFPEHDLRPGVLMSLIGGPLFLFLLFKNRRALRAW